MFRFLVVATLVASLAGCRTYDAYTPVASQSGLVPADQAAQYGTEQAQVIAIGRALGAAYAGPRPEDRARQVTAAVEYALGLPDVRTVVPDTLGVRLTITFASGWRTAALPIEDGVGPDLTAGLPPRR